MYSIYDKEAAILQIQRFLGAVGDKTISVAPSGVYDENTRLSVIEFQKKNGIEQSGVVDYITYGVLYEKYAKYTDEARIKESNAHLLDFPILPEGRPRGMAHLNVMLSSLMNYYGQSHNLMEGTNFYTRETANAVKTMRKIYDLEPVEYIDTELYERLIRDIGEIEKNKFVRKS